MAVGDEDVAIGRDYDIGGVIERVFSCAGNAGFSQYQEDFAVGIHFENLLAFAVFGAAVADPDVVIAVNVEAVSLNEHALSEAFEKPAAGVELKQRCVRAVEDPDVTVRIGVD